MQVPGFLEDFFGVPGGQEGESDLGAASHSFVNSLLADQDNANHHHSGYATFGTSGRSEEGPRDTRGGEAGAGFSLAASGASFASELAQEVGFSFSFVPKVSGGGAPQTPATSATPTTPFPFTPSAFLTGKDHYAAARVDALALDLSEEGREMIDEEEEEEEEGDSRTSTAPTTPSSILSSPLGHLANSDGMSGQLSSLEVSSRSYGPRKKRKHEEEVPFSLHTKTDPQRLVAVPALPDTNLMATEMPLSNFTPNSTTTPKIEPLSSFVPPTQQAPAPPPQTTSLHLFPSTGGHNTAQDQLNQVHNLQVLQKEQLIQMHQVQRKIMMQPEQQAFKELDVEQRQTKMKIEEELAYLRQIISSHILDPPDLHKHSFLRQDLELQLKQVDLYHRELQTLVQPGPRCIAALSIVKQPFPLIISKNKQISDDELEVRLLTGAVTEIKSCALAKAILIIDNHQTKGIAEKSLGDDEQPLDLSKQTAKFPLKFLQGTRKNSVTLKFSMQLKVGQGETAMTTTVESEASRHFVVITNEIQWQGSAGTLLKRDAFDGQLEITWPQFANALQRHVLKATKQDPVRPTRCLSGYDLRYIKAKFFGNRDVLTQKDFDSFWGWFGKNLQMLRYQRHISNLWQQGLIYGFLTRVDVDGALQGQEPGTFLLRFSERHSGQFGVAYVGMEPPHKIKHYLIQKSDTAGAKKTLPDFLGDCPQFRFLLQLTANPQTGEAMFRKLLKDTCLKSYYSKRAPPPTGSGYDPL
eukprot:TRINITY_DN516_c6_g1_i1.p1 TRINITY_DN516_c6_g1~~TRINITY_DN516_c6_g1_i1.p1  ORF type:complete len:751 (+),score=126.06 TRINITY_DN516_c6_g1_i1:143-2395(+)